MLDTETDMQKDEQSKSIENRKKLNFWARFVLSLVVFGTFLLLLYLLFFQEVGDTYRDIVNILVGSFVAILTKTADYWFKDKDDPEHKETEKLNTTTNGITP